MVSGLSEGSPPPRVSLFPSARPRPAAGGDDDDAGEEEGGDDDEEDDGFFARSPFFSPPEPPLRYAPLRKLATVCGRVVTRETRDPPVICDAARTGHSANALPSRIDPCGVRMTSTETALYRVRVVPRVCASPPGPRERTRAARRYRGRETTTDAFHDVLGPILVLG